MTQNIPTGANPVVLPPFSAWLASNIPAVYDNTMSYYEELTSLIKYLESVVLPAVNENSQSVTELARLYKELKDYVDHYFENLDVQEEINNKLDEMAASGYFDEILDEYFSKKVSYIFPKYSSAGSSEFNLIKIQDKNETKWILIDCGLSSRWTTLMQMFTDYGISHLDMFIISHYDSDHIGNVSNLITYHLIDSDTIVYTPVQYGFNSAYSNAITATNALLTNAGISFRTPDELEEITYNGVKMTFANTDATIVSQYTTQRLSNSCSSVILFEYGTISALYTGDATKTVLNRLYDTNFPGKTVDLYKQPHHGIDTDCSVSFITSVKPRYAVQTASIQDFSHNNFNVCPETRLMKEFNTNIYPCYLNKDYIEFESTINTIECIKGINVGISTARIEQTYYVDASIDISDYQNGTQDYPFKEIEQAIAYVQAYVNSDVTINVGPGSYSLAHVDSGPDSVKNVLHVYTGKSSIIRIVGTGDDPSDVLINGVMVQYTNVNLTNVTINCRYRDGLRSIASDIELDNVVITTDNDEVSTAYSCALIRNNSNLWIKGPVTFKNGNRLILLQYGSSIKNAYSITFGPSNTGIMQRDRDCLVLNFTRSNILFEDGVDGSSFHSYFMNVPSGKEILDSVSSDKKTITLSESIYDFAYIEIKGTNSAIRGSTGKIIVPSSGNCTTTLNIPVIGSNGTSIYYKVTRYIANGTSITAAAREFALNAGNSLSYSGAEVTPAEVTSVIGYVKDNA